MQESERILTSRNEIEKRDTKRSVLTRRSGLPLERNNDERGRIVTEAELSELKESTKGDSADVQIPDTLDFKRRMSEKDSRGRIVTSHTRNSRMNERESEDVQIPDNARLRTNNVREKDSGGRI